MPIETLKRFLADEDVELRRFLSFIFSGLVSSAVRVDEEDFAGLKAALVHIEATLEGKSNTEHLLVAAGAAIQALDSHNQRTTRFIRRQGAELQKIITMLAETVVTIGGAGERSAHALGEIKTNLEHASGLEDLQNVKAQLGKCLEQVCEESVRRKEDAQTAIVQLQQQIRRAESHLTNRAEVDSVTDLPARPAAEAALVEALTKPGRKYIGVFVFERLQSINVRFGNAVGDQVLAELARHVQTSLPAGDALFRWSGPALLAIMPRLCSIERMRIELNPIVGKPLQKEFTIGGRNVLIPISAAWAVFGLIPPLPTILKYVDTFVATQAPKEFV